MRPKARSPLRWSPPTTRRWNASGAPWLKATLEAREANLKHAQRLSKAYLDQLAALDKHRGRGQQKITVEHVTVEAGGQAIVGSVETSRSDGSGMRGGHAAEQDRYHRPKIETGDPSVPDEDTRTLDHAPAAITIGHIGVAQKDEWSVLIPRAKADQAGGGRVAWLSPTSEFLARWLDESGLDTGPLFRALHRRRLSEGPLDPTSVRRIIKRAARRAVLDSRLADGLSGHSMRVGAVPDMMVAGFDTLAIMQVGGWKTSHVLLRYVENASTHEVHAKRWARLG